MNRIDRVFHQGKVFSAYITAGDGNTEQQLAYVHALLEGGVNLLEIGVPFSDPIADGPTIQFASNMCRIAKEGKIAIASSVKELIADDLFQKERKHFLNLLPHDEHLLKLLFSKLEENWQDADFDISDYCEATAMSSSQLYRKTIALTSLPPNSLVKDFRLQKAKELMRKRYYNIAQITFDSGFTSASYFTKCFKKKYGLLPITYLELLH